MADKYAKQTPSKVFLTFYPNDNSCYSDSCFVKWLLLLCLVLISFRLKIEENKISLRLWFNFSIPQCLITYHN